MKKIIVLKNIRKSFVIGERNIDVLKGIDLEIEDGEFLAIQGVSGSGKSTLLYILGLMDRPTSGEYLLQGRRVEHLEDEELSELRNALFGFVFQQFYLIDYLNAYDNVILPILYSKKAIPYPRERARRLLDKLGLSNRYFSKPSQLSGGEQQRVAIARALINEPQVILADEPTGQLDSRTANEIMDIFSTLNNEGKTIIMVTHDEAMAKRAKRILRIKDGLLFS